MTAAELLAVQEHRPFPPPNSPWIMRQEWHHLLFAHWPLPAEIIRPLVPPQFELDLWQGHAYLGIVPFEIKNLRLRGTPSIPVFSDFAEINVRTYVTFNGVPGVWFFSLDAANLSAVLAARFFYALPYYHAQFTIRQEGETTHYRSSRKQRPKPADFSASYRPTSSVLAWQAPAQSLDHFLTERYCLYAASGGHVYRTAVHHLPWPLQVAEADIGVNTITAPLSMPLHEPAPLLHYSSFLDVLVWPPRQVS